MPGREGDIVALPLQTPGWGVGVVARTKRGTRLIYFFGLKYSNPPGPEQVPLLAPESAILIERVSDVGLEDGEWKVVGRVPGWTQDQWPIPRFAERTLRGATRLVTYGQHDFSRPVSIERVPSSVVEGLPSHAFSGHIASSMTLTRLLSTVSPLPGMSPAENSKEMAAPPERTEAREGMSGDSVILHFTSPATDVTDQLWRLEAQLEEAISTAGAGELDGNLLGAGELIIYCYGPDCDALWSAVEPHLFASTFAPTHAELLRGGAEPSETTKLISDGGRAAG
ncbi:immunity 26/phosphotriesterase HocA family protein [Herbiconiux sp. P15]|uniref:immunity 26/phosphotriesterase HocA family protein n=1 Tax=Herbiconiux liukaitaii TaxID=3342799 RepID=UPI0035B8941D